MHTLAGSSPATSAPGAALTTIRRLVAECDETPADLEELRGLSPEVASALADFEAEYGWRLTTGYDLGDLTMNELPEVLFASVSMSPRTDPDLGGDETMNRLRELVPTEERTEFDQLVSDARLLYGLRDENGPITNEWPAGLLRRAVLAAADRLTAAGHLDDPDEVFEISAAEITNLLTTGNGPTPSAIHARRVESERWATLEAPGVLGRVQEPPPAWVLPPSLARLMDVIQTVMTLLETSGTSETLHGTGVGDTAYTGTARVVTDADDALHRLAPGDILVAPFTVPTYNAVLAMAGALVVEHGGLLCHAAVIAREFGIAGVVGASGATTKIPDGATIEVDPVSGSVTVVESDQLTGVDVHRA
jgi:pyruvate,water dikinase